jgi:hypothetical protein
MGNYSLNEPAIAAVLARLEDPAQLNAEIASIAAGVTAADQAASLVPVPVANINDFVPPPSFLVDFPQIGIQDMGTRLEDDTGHSATGRHNLGIVIFCSDPNPEILAWELRRYAQAVVRVMLRDRAFTEAPAAGWAIGAADPLVAWGPTLSKAVNPQVWMSWCVVQIWTRREEI